MVTYGDYFSKKVLSHCGVSPEKTLFEQTAFATAGTERMKKIRGEMAGIYQTLYRGYTQKNSVEGDFADFQVERKIVAAFYDAGVLSKSEREYLQTQSAQDLDGRERICVEEASFAGKTDISKQVDAPTKTPLVREML